ncbi:hypothetical protein IEQ34_022277 [Dendrobium chrysotoxum]|uniref:Uncharacterized protein n=1 Tax=Dendrobium chrysotoxum TaxID=161865 RepID=A0AAV7FYK0_DENCH|nr:hypothetical protein IEQ34_022277 [Dendrobium chrysotoxum]
MHGVQEKDKIDAVDILIKGLDNSTFLGLITKLRMIDLKKFPSRWRVPYLLRKGDNKRLESHEAFNRAMTAIALKEKGPNTNY